MMQSAEAQCLRLSPGARHECNAARISATRINPPLRAGLARTWRTLTHDLFDSYRPERHYMRGPGPKWHAKH